MTIELITGTPGAGKTTFMVATRLVKEHGRKIPLDPETCIKLGFDLGHVVERRIVAAGVRGLVVDHERLGHILTRDGVGPNEVAKWNAMVTERDEATGKSVESDAPVWQRLPGDPPRTDVTPCVQNWWLWCMPGDLIVIDEAQFLMPRGTLGRKPPFWLQAFEIHRHYGVDFIIVTQHPQLIDTTVRALVGLHRHIRAVMGSPVCMVYVWDHASNPERYNLANKTTFVRRRAHFKLFNSTVAVVKPPTSGRSALLIVPVLVAGVWFGVQHFKAKWTGPAAEAAPASSPSHAASAPRPASSSSSSPALSAPGSAADIVASFTPRIAARPNTAPAYDQLRRVTVMPQIIGGYCMNGVCRCFTQQGTDAGIPADDCSAWHKSPPFDPYRVSRSDQAAPASASVTPSSTSSPVARITGS